MGQSEEDAKREQLLAELKQLRTNAYAQLTRRCKQATTLLNNDWDDSLETSVETTRIELQQALDHACEAHAAYSEEVMEDDELPAKDEAN